MKKYNITTGVYWIEIPEAQLNILCGCPADAVKHLMRRGFIVTTDDDKFTYETGPNAILLSELPMQGGSFANLSEFPVLQMLYRQGMIIPDHPNNTGVKPLLIGTKEQVEAQSQYIYRGNYGLCSLEELIEAGVNLQLATDMMCLKKKFAFGRLHDTEELLDIKVVADTEVHLRNQVFLKRLQCNVFEFTYQNQTVTVDLNLSTNQTYEPTYQLGFHNIQRQYFSIIHCGEGDGWDVNRPCMGSIITFQGKIYLIDAGPHIQHSLIALGININDIEGIFHTHAHDDHFSGLTSLIHSNTVIKYFAPKLVRHSVEKKMSVLLGIQEKEFSKYFEIHDLEFNTWNNIDGLEVKPIFSPHPIETAIYLFRTLWVDGFKSYAHWADVCSFKVLEGMVTFEPTTPGINQTYYEQIKADYLTRADLKKVDIGGGMIHGSALDYAKDPTEKIILSHIARPLSAQEKEIGSTANFGIQDVLIHSSQDYSMQLAFQYLHSYFPDVAIHELRLLLNCPVTQFNSGTILLKKGNISHSLYLILRGVMEYIESENNIQNTLSTGSLIDEVSCLLGEKSKGTFRAMSHVQVLEIPRNLYYTFVKNNNLYDNVTHWYSNQQFLRSTWLFGEMTAYPMQKKIAQLMQSVHYLKGQTISGSSKPEIFLLEKGAMNIHVGENIIEQLSSGDFFGEESIVNTQPPLFNALFTIDSFGYTIPGEFLRKIPIIRWKLLETLKKRENLTELHCINKTAN